MRAALRGNKLIKLWGTTDAKQIGLLYLISSFFFIVAGIEALLVRVELARPGMQSCRPPTNDQG